MNAECWKFENEKTKKTKKIKKNIEKKNDLIWFEKNSKKIMKIEKIENWRDFENLKKFRKI